MLRMTDLDLRGRRVLIREDLNVPLKDGVVASDARIQAALPTIRTALDAGAAVMVMSHLGRPSEGQFDPAFSLAPVAAHLGKLLGMDVPLVAEWLDGAAVEPGQVVLFENTRFLKGEKADDEQLSRKPLPLPTLAIKRRPPSIFEYRFEDFEILNYEAHPHIKAAVAV